jgi:hypothetical protein
MVARVIYKWLLNYKGGITMLSLINSNLTNQPIEGENVSRLIQDYNYESYLKHLHHVKLAKQRHKKQLEMAVVV